MTAIDAGIAVKEITNYAAANAASDIENSLQANNSVTYQNIAQDVRDTYTLINGNWVGSELITNGDFATDSDWTKGAGWSIQLFVFRHFQEQQLSSISLEAFIIADLGVCDG